MIRLLALISVALMTIHCDNNQTDPPEDGGVDGDADADADTDDEEEECLNGANESPITGPCNCSRDCVEGTVCTSEEESGYPDGYCGLPCTADGGECGDGASCELVVGLDAGLCYQDCTDHSDCRDGWACHFGVCKPHCVDDDQCMSGHCNTYQDLCYDGSELTGAEPYESCVRDEDCKSQICMTDIGGYCVGFCIVEPDACPPDTICSVPEHDCPGDTICVGNIDANDALTGLCMKPCEGHQDCPGDLRCYTLYPEGTAACWE